MWKWCLAFAAGQSQDELQRQFGVVKQVEGQRRLLALLPFAISALYLPVWIALTLMVLNLCLEVVAQRLLGRTNPQREPHAYLLMLACFGLSQICYMLAPALAWLHPDVFAKAYAVGAFLISIVHIATIRTVHFPLAMGALIPAALIALGANTMYWIKVENGAGLAISTLCVIAVAHFARITMATVHQLHQEMFRDQQAAEAANDAKSRFLAQMSHELRTPLNAILGMGIAELAGAGSVASRERLTTMVQSARSLAVLLDDILDMSAVQAGQLPIKPVALNLHAEVGAAVALFRQQIADSGQSMTYAIAEDVPDFAHIDGQRLRQCLSNVIANAIKYAGSGTIDIAVRRQGSDLFSIAVTDSGPGVPEALRESIFEPFQRGDSQLPGTGLGLSISRTLARRMGGDLALVPSAKGAKFLLSFALQPAVAADVAAPQATVLADLGGKRVLVVDDVGTNRLVAMAYLRIMGATPSEAPGGAAALDMLTQGGVDLVLLDMRMEGLDGLETFRRIRALPGALGRVPVIAMTADATEDHRRHYLGAGLNGYLSKPLSPEAMSAVIAAALARSRA